jgi:hypothetical protein
VLNANKRVTFQCVARDCTLLLAPPVVARGIDHQVAQDRSQLHTDSLEVGH